MPETPPAGAAMPSGAARAAGAGGDRRDEGGMAAQAMDAGSHSAAPDKSRQDGGIDRRDRGVENRSQPPGECRQR